MDILLELKGLLGSRIKLVETIPDREESGLFSHATTQYFPLEDGKWLAVDTESLAPETVGMLRLLLEKHKPASRLASGGWFTRFIQDEWKHPAELISSLANADMEISLPARLAVIECRSEGTELVPELLQETLADESAVAVAADRRKRYWLYLPEAEGALEDWQESAAIWVDTLLTEFYLDARIGISGSLQAAEELPRARNEAEIALYAGTSYQPKQAVHTYGELGVAHILHGVSKEAKTAFLNEILPAGMEAGLTQDLRETIAAFARHGQNISETARALFIHRNTLLYRLERIQETTGRDIRQFEDLFTLWIALLLQNEQTIQ